MRRKQVFSLLMLVVGVALLVAAMTVGVASSATQKASKRGAALKGGTLRLNEAEGDFDYVDPQLQYRSDDAQLVFATSMNLMNYPEKPGDAGSVIYPEAASAPATVSNNGKTYTFHIRPGLKFSDGTAVTAAAFQRSWERILSPKMGSPNGVNLHLESVIQGGQAFLAGKTQKISGITAKGLTLTFRLQQANPAFVSILAMPWFTAVKPNMPYTTTGVQTYAAAGPYYVASRDPGRTTVLKRNPYYKGSRPANPDQIVFTANVNTDQSLLQVKAGQADMDIIGIPPTAASDLGKQYGVNKGRFFVGSTTCVNYMGMNTARPAFSNLNLRKAVNWAIDRPAQVRLLGAYSGQRTDQILVPGVPGYKPYHAYAISGADVARAKEVGGAAIASAPVLNVIHTTSTYSTNRAQVAEYNLKAVGFKVKDIPTPSTTYYEVLETKGSTYDFVTNGGWCADYFDPYDYINVLFDGRTIQATNNVDYTFFNNATFNKQMDAAAQLSGPARSVAYAKLDQELMTKYAPVVPYIVSSNRYFVSSRVKDFIYSNYFGGPYWNALSVG